MLLEGLLRMCVQDIEFPGICARVHCFVPSNSGGRRLSKAHYSSKSGESNIAIHILSHRKERSVNTCTCMYKICYSTYM